MCAAEGPPFTSTVQDYSLVHIKYNIERGKVIPEYIEGGRSVLNKYIFRSQVKVYYM